MSPSPPTFHADHIGSLLRPEALLNARAAASLSSPSEIYSKVSSDTVKNVQTAAIESVVNAQLSRHITPVTDGEFGRSMFYSGLFESTSGFTIFPSLPIPDAFRTDFPTTTGLAKMAGAKSRASAIATSRIEYKPDSSPYLNEWLTLRSFLPRDKWNLAKLTISAPSYQHIQLEPGTAWTKDSGYSNDEEYFCDLAAIYRHEMQTLYAHGLRNVQIDDPHLTYFCDEQFLAGCRKDGVDTDDLLDLYLRAHNLCLQDKPTDLHVGVHLCRGNAPGSTNWVGGSYDAIAEKLFTQTDYLTYYLEFDDETRQGGLDVLRLLPRANRNGWCWVWFQPNVSRWRKRR